MHEQYKVGDYWDHMPEYEQQTRCQHCQTTESVEHILPECCASGQEMIWDLAKKLREGKTPGFVKNIRGISM